MAPPITPAINEERERRRSHLIQFDLNEKSSTKPTKKKKKLFKMTRMRTQIQQLFRRLFGGRGIIVWLYVFFFLTPSTHFFAPKHTTLS